MLLVLAVYGTAMKQLHARASESPPPFATIKALIAVMRGSRGAGRVPGPTRGRLETLASVPTCRQGDRVAGWRGNGVLTQG